MNKSRRLVSAFSVVALSAVAVLQALAHPATHGGIRSGGGVAIASPYTAIVPEFVADRKAGQVRLYVVQETDEKVDGKKMEMARNLTVRREAVGKSEAILLPLPDHPKNEEWFTVPPVRKSNGFAFYRIELAMRVSLDGKPAADLAFDAGKDARGFHCLVAPLDMAAAQNLRIESATLSVYDAAKKESWSRKLFEKAWGSGFKNVTYGTDLSLAQFEASVAKSGDLDKNRKPQAPEVTAK